ncbi:MAG: hypothetical protein ACD_72C00440G0001 [uncultured bacterium]|nr:MAG: hypothetical protein ACD_72C00440G0001 [uncultured bacterium]
MVNHFRFKLCARTSQKFFLGLRNTKFIKSIFYFFWYIFPFCFSFILRSHIVANVFKIYPRQIRTPSRHCIFEKNFMSIQTIIQHPFRLFFESRNFTDQTFGQSSRCLKNTFSFGLKTKSGRIAGIGQDFFCFLRNSHRPIYFFRKIS